MNITFTLKGVKTIKKLYVRLYQNKLDLSVSTDMMLMDLDWDAENQSIKNDADSNLNIQELKVFILRRFNKDFSSGTIIDKDWLQKCVKTSFMRPNLESNLINPEHTLYLSSFCAWWMENHSENWKTSHKKVMSNVLKSQYNSFVDLLKCYEELIDYKLQLRNLSVNEINSFVDFLENKEYQVATIERIVGRFRFFMNRALEFNFDVSQAYKQKIYMGENEDLNKVFLTKEEIEKITSKDFSFDSELDIAKQNLLILVHTGMRGGDFLKNMDLSKINNGFINLKTSKTGQSVVIPLHKTVKKILNINFGNLPPKMTLFDFNKSIKEICRICDINDLVDGKKFDSSKKRKVRSIYKKWELISSHSCRRGFATMYKGKISDEAICSILGWSSSEMLKLYNQTTKIEYANELNNLWSKTN